MNRLKYIIVIWIVLFIDMMSGYNLIASPSCEYYCNFNRCTSFVPQHDRINDDIEILIRDGKIFFDNKVDSITIIDITGKTVYKGTNVYCVDLNYRRGVYVIVVVRNKISKTFKIKI